MSPPPASWPGREAESGDMASSGAFSTRGQSTCCERARLDCYFFVPRTAPCPSRKVGASEQTWNRRTLQCSGQPCVTNETGPMGYMFTPVEGGWPWGQWASEFDVSNPSRARHDRSCTVFGRGIHQELTKDARSHLDPDGVSRPCSRCNQYA
jgi:hypothetical protein